MSSFIVQDKVSSYKLDVSFDTTVSALVDDSGTGKTFLFKLLLSYSEKRGIKTFLCNSTLADKPKDILLDLCKTSDLILLDNADLYLDNDFLSDIKALEKQTIICIKNTYKLNMQGVGIYCLSYENRELKTMKISRG